MTIDKSRRVFLALVMLAISSVALIPGPAFAKPTIRPAARSHRIYWMPDRRPPAPQSKRPADDPFAFLLLG
jgi:hypothetical protein